jgi:AcrR family transcriptional regulator
MLALATSRPGENGRAAPGATPYHHGDLRRALLQAAEELLERGGGHAALSLREVARAAGVSHAAPYRHFADREALLAALAADGFARLADALTAAAAAAPEGGRTRAAGRAYLRFARAHRALYLLMFGPEIRKSAHPALAEAAGAAMAALRGAGEADRGAADRGGSGEAARARHAMVGAWALVHGLAHLIADGQLAEDLAADDYMALSEDVLATYGAGLRAKQG